MKNVVFGEYFARFEGIWQTKCIKDEEVDKLSVENKAKDGEEIPMRAIMMRRNTNDGDEVYQWWKEQVKREEGDDEEEEAWKSISQWIHTNKRSMMTC